MTTNSIINNPQIKALIESHVTSNYYADPIEGEPEREKWQPFEDYSTDYINECIKTDTWVAEQFILKVLLEVAKQDTDSQLKELFEKHLKQKDTPTDEAPQ